MPPDADSEKSKFEKRLCVTKDIVPLSDPERAFLVVAVIGNVNRENSWDEEAVRIYQPVNLKDDDGSKK